MKINYKNLRIIGIAVVVICCIAIGVFGINQKSDADDTTTVTSSTIESTSKENVEKNTEKITEDNSKETSKETSKENSKENDDKNTEEKTEKTTNKNTEETTVNNILKDAIDKIKEDKEKAESSGSNLFQETLDKMKEQNKSTTTNDTATKFYKNENDTTYHTEGCEKLKESNVAITLIDVMKDQLTPCEICNH